MQKNAQNYFGGKSRIPACFSQMNGIFVLDKPVGPSSAQCLNSFKKLGQKKIGHAGTLDPAASGVLLVLLGNATKIMSYLHEGGVKVYSGRLRLGVETDTWDMSGCIQHEATCQHIKTEDIDACVRSWVGKLEQTIPPYSAAKYHGQPLYKLARRGCDTPLKTKNIEITNAEILQINMPFVDFRVVCSSGSYIRSLAHSLGKRLGCGAALQGLTREYSHPFGLEKACALGDLQRSPGILRENLVPLENALPDWDRIQLNPTQAKDVRNGRPLYANNQNGREYAILMEREEPLALAHLEYRQDGKYWTILRGLWG